MKTSRRTFAKIAVAAAFAPKETLWAEEPPLLKVGLITDTHVGKTKESCSRARLAYELFRDVGVDMIVNDGDVADHHYPTGYVAYREMVEETFAGVPAERRPQELFVYAWHDAYDYKGHPREDSTKDAPEAFADMQRLIKSPNGPYAEGEIKGFPYVVIPQFEGREGKLDWDRFDKMLSAAEKSHPGKPVFVIAHVPPADTTRGRRGSSDKRRVLNRHPMAVNISGHSHGSMRDDRAIWQGEFTSINVGCLQTWGGGRLAGEHRSVRRLEGRAHPQGERGRGQGRARRRGVVRGRTVQHGRSARVGGSSPRGREGRDDRAVRPPPVRGGAEATPICWLSTARPMRSLSFSRFRSARAPRPPWIWGPAPSSTMASCALTSPR